MKSITNIFSSITAAMTLIVVYFISAAIATFVENDFGVSASSWLVYKSSWFNTLHILLVIIMISVIIKYKMFQLKKLGVLVFHIGFVITIIGAGLTRFIGYEGTMHIRTGETSNKIITNPSFLFTQITHNDLLYVSELPVKFNKLKNPSHTEEINFKEKKFKLKITDYIANAAERIAKDTNGETILLFMISDGISNNEFFIKQATSKILNTQKFSFNDGNDPSAIHILDTDTGLIVSNPYPMHYRNMSDTIEGIIPAGATTKFVKNRLYEWNMYKLVIKEIYTNANTIVKSNKNTNQFPLDAISVEISDKKTSKQFYVFGKERFKGEPVIFSINDYNFEVSYGSKEIELPFSLTLNKFSLERYPGSMSPSSYESNVTLTDKENNYSHKYNIFMNNVLNYRGYRFFQSSYDPDEHGTILSVNKDTLGTYLTYLGYILLTLGMFITIFNKNSRYRSLGKKLKEMSNKKAAILIIGLFVSFSGFAQEKSNLPVINIDHSDKFGHLQVQTQQGRIEPINTLSNELLRKLSKRSTYKGLNSDQVFISMIVAPEAWAKEPLIKITHPELIKMFNAKDKHIALSDVFDINNNYKIQKLVQTAYEKNNSRRNMLDKDIIKLDEKVNILYNWLNGDYLTIFPKPFDENNKWYNLNNAGQVFVGEDSAFIYNVFQLYYSDLLQATKTNSWAKADSSLAFINMYQQKAGANVILSEKKINSEILYNKASIFRHLFEFYFIIGLIYLVFLFVKILYPKLKTKYLDYGFFSIILIAFVFHNSGLILRWYVSGHAPWSNGYESMIYISWATMLAGFIYYRNSKIALAATTVLAGMVLLVAHLSWIDPQITNLVPVLKSYWLTIHVSVITASYGFLALGALLGFINLILIIFKNAENKEHIDFNIKKITYINEMSLTLGLFLLTIGTFLGGVWANESWGRYWGWDPKETWALISMLVYAFVIHMRFIPGLRGFFAFNFAALISISSVIMTYFGVNYYLSGLHSYASGDPVPIPAFVFYSLAVVLVISLFAFIKDKKINNITTSKQDIAKETNNKPD